MAWFRNQSASELERVRRRINRAEAKSPLRNGTMIEGVLTIAGDARIEYEGGANVPEIPNATPTRSGLMTDAYAAKLEGLPETLVSTEVGTRITVGGVDAFYDSGLRDISGYGRGVTSASRFQIRRTLDSLVFTYSFLFGSSGTGARQFLDELPLGWRPAAPAIDTGAQGGGRERHDIRISDNFTAAWNFVADADGDISQAQPTSGSRVEGTLIIPAQTTLPASLIGDPA